MEKQSTLKKILIGIVILILGVGAVIGYRHYKLIQKNKNLSSANSQAVSFEKIKGPDSAPIKILNFSDFQCPACGTAVPIIESLMQKYPGQIQLVFKHFPLRMHVWAPVAHQSAECAAQQGKFWEYYNLIYRNQLVWSALPDPMVSYATYANEVGMNMDAFSQCMVDTKIAERITAEKQEGEVLEVKSTPTFFINGKMFAGPQEVQIGGEEFIRKTLGLAPNIKDAPQPQATLNYASATSPQAEPTAPQPS